MKIEQVNENGSVCVVNNVQSIKVDWEKDEEDLKVQRNMKEMEREMVWTKTGKDWREEDDWVDMEQDYQWLLEEISDIINDTQGYYVTNPFVRKLRKGLMKEEE